METQFALLAENAVVDYAGRISILGVIDRLRFGSFPARLPFMTLVLQIRLHGHDFDEALPAIIRILGPDGEALITAEHTLPAHPRPAGAAAVNKNHLLRLKDVQIPAAGEYTVAVTLKGQLVADLPLVAEGLTG